MKSITHLARAAAIFVVFLYHGSQVHGQTPNPVLPVGNITAQLSIVQTGAIANLTWSIRLPDGEIPANYTHFIRQIHYPDGLIFDTSVASSGQMLSVPLGPNVARFELWSVRSSPPVAFFLDATACSSHLPAATVTIRSEDPYPYLPRTRADRSFHVDVDVQGLLNDPEAPESSRSVTLLRHVQSYGATGVGNNIDRTQATLLSQSAITTNGAFTSSFQNHSIPGGDSSKIRGEERFSIMTVEDFQMPASVIDSKFIQIWPVADTSIAGITNGQSIGPAVPALTLNLNDLYPSSTTYAQVYKGSPRPNAIGRIVPGSMFVINSATPQNRVATVQDYLSLFDSDGVWTMELLTQTPFGTDRMSVISFTVEGTASIRGDWRLVHFESRDNSGDGADMNDFDRDGLTNLVEFAFGLDPKKADNGSMPVTQADGNQLSIDFTQPSGVGGVTYAAEWSHGMQPGSWMPIVNSAVPPRHAFGLSMGANAAAFMRLKVTGQ